MVATQSLKNGVKAMARRSADGPHNDYVGSLDISFALASDGSELDG